MGEVMNTTELCDAGSADSSVAKALALLDCFGSNERSLGVTDMARRAKLPKSTVHRLAGTLVGSGYLERSEDGRYQLGIHLFELGHRVTAAGTICRRGAPLVHRLSRITGETAHLAILDADDVVYLAKVDGSYPCDVPSQVGQRNPAVATAVGKAILAWRPRHELQRLTSRGLPMYTSRSLQSVDALLREVEEIRRTNQAIDDGQRAVNLVCMAAPVRDRTGKVVAGVSLAGASERLTTGRRVELAAHLQTAASRISTGLGFHAQA
jgi:IclR family acetate operon transcriptional repressor